MAKQNNQCVLTIKAEIVNFITKFLKRLLFRFTAEFYSKCELKVPMALSSGLIKYQLFFLNNLRLYFAIPWLNRIIYFIESYKHMQCPNIFSFTKQTICDI